MKLVVELTTNAGGDPDAIADAVLDVLCAADYGAQDHFIVSFDAVDPMREDT